MQVSQLSSGVGDQVVVDRHHQSCGGSGWTWRRRQGGTGENRVATTPDFFGWERRPISVETQWFELRSGLRVHLVQTLPFPDGDPEADRVTIKVLPKNGRTRLTVVPE